MTIWHSGTTERLYETKQLYLYLAFGESVKERDFAYIRSTAGELQLCNSSRTENDITLPAKGREN